MASMPQDIVRVTPKAKDDSYAHTDSKINKAEEVTQ